MEDIMIIRSSFMRRIISQIINKALKKQMHDIQEEAMRLWASETVNWNMTDAYSLCRTCANFRSWTCLK